MKHARLAAFEVLYSVFSEDAYSNLALEHALRDVDSKERSFASRLVYGVIEHRLTLDYLLQPYLKGKTKPKVKIVLLLGMYQLYYMNSVPSHAVINESVSLAAEVGCGYYKGLVNAVLRRADDNRIDVDAIKDWSIRFSCPEHLIRMWKKQYGEEKTAQMLSVINERPPMYAVPNTKYVTADELQYELSSEGVVCETCGALVRLDYALDIAASAAYRNGLFYIEDQSAHDCAMVVGAKPGETVIDFCAAPGGKSYTMAQAMQGEGNLWALDLYPHRVALIEDGAKRLGLDNITCMVNDATKVNAAFPMADRILCDVPCSGFGIVRRKPEIRYKSLDSVKELPELQYCILFTSAQYLKAGGTLVYATCTLNQKENEQVVQRFLQAHGDFTLCREHTAFPDREAGDGFYYAVMEKQA